MQWLLDNWIWILIAGGFVAMHLFGHGGHGGRSKSRDGPHQTEQESGSIARSKTVSKSGDKAGEENAAEKRRGV